MLSVGKRGQQLLALIPKLDDPDPSVRKWATNALTHVEPDYFQPAMNWLSTPFDLPGP
jgi:hypothetical protein